MVVYIMGIETLMGQIIMSLAEGFSLAAAFIFALVIVKEFEKPNQIRSYGLISILYMLIGLVVALIILVPIHFTIGV